MKIEELFVCKLVSQNPDEFKLEGLSRMANKYGEYCIWFSKSDTFNGEYGTPKPKSFDEWLLTEI